MPEVQLTREEYAQMMESEAVRRATTLVNMDSERDAGGRDGGGSGGGGGSFGGASAILEGAALLRSAPLPSLKVRHWGRFALLLTRHFCTIPPALSPSHSPTSPSSP